MEHQTPPPITNNPYQAPQSQLVDEDIHNNNVQATKMSRLLAKIIDAIIGMVCAIPVWMMTGLFADMQQGILPSASTQIIFALWGIAAYVVVHGYLLKNSSQTVGKRIMGIYIANVDNDERAELITIVVKRFTPQMLFAYIPVVGPFLNLANILLIFRKDRRCGHDLIAGTHVLQVLK